MYSPPYIFFHSLEGYRWADGTDPALRKLCTINDAPNDLLPSLTINVSKPDALMTWLETNSAARISNLSIFVNATSFSPSPQRWCRLFGTLRQEATNIQHLSIYWDADGPWGTRPPWNIEDALHFGLGKSVVFVRGLAQIKVKKSVEIGGFYAKHWPQYLEEKMGLIPVNRQNCAWAGLRLGRMKTSPGRRSLSRGEPGPNQPIHIHASGFHPTNPYPYRYFRIVL